MATKKYIYQKESSEWVFGPTKNSICPAGIYRLVVETTGKLTVRHIYNRDITYQYADSHADFLKENDEAYASLNELISATSDFFSGPIKVNIVGSDIQIGAVELKNADSDDRAKIGAGTSMGVSDKALAVADPNIKEKLTDGSQKTQLVNAENENIDFVDYLLQTGRIVSHGKITDLTSAFSLENDIPFALFIIPKSEGDHVDDTTAVVDCKLHQDDESANCPFTLNCWDTPAVIQVAASGIDLTQYDVYWGAGTKAEVAS